MQIAASFRNCLAECPTQVIVEARTGQICFYEWSGAEPALLEFNACLPLGWRLTEAKAPKNAALSARTRRKILTRLAHFEAFALVWSTDESELLAGLM